jgi:hypothetical protein
LYFLTKAKTKNVKTVETDIDGEYFSPGEDAEDEKPYSLAKKGSKVEEKVSKLSAYKTRGDFLSFARS